MPPDQHKLLEYAERVDRACDKVSISADVTTNEDYLEWCAATFALKSLIEDIRSFRPEDSPFEDPPLTWIQGGGLRRSHAP